ncbi:protein TonB-like [Macrobrachium rosenbergii]|uniref:protein TonB-like n=1 Tax=Macrobrachium rosenbergii TaxID=79674 RepID=UPI0034D5E855
MTDYDNGWQPRGKPRGRRGAADEADRQQTVKEALHYFRGLDAPRIPPPTPSTPTPLPSPPLPSPTPSTLPLLLTHIPTPKFSTGVHPPAPQPSPLVPRSLSKPYKAHVRVAGGERGQMTLILR